MKKKIFYLIAVIFLFNDVKAQSFQKTFGTSGEDYATDVIQTTDKGYAILGVLNGSGVYLLKTDSLGNKQWSKKLLLQTPSIGQLRTFAQTADGGYVFSGIINYSSTYYSFVVKTDGLGNVTWSKMHVALSSIVSIKQTLEGDYIAVGSQYFGGKGTLVRFNSSGNIVWSRTLPLVSSAMDVIQLSSDSSFITSYFSSSSSSNINISRFSKNANLIWSKDITSPAVQLSPGYGRLHENGSDIQIAVNSSSCPGILSVNKNGSSAKLFGVSCQLYNYFISDAYPTANKGSFLVGQYNVSSSGYGTRNILLALLDSLGTVQWAKQIGGPNDEAPICVKKTTGKGAIIAGHTKSFSSGYKDIYLIKTDSLGQSGCNTTSTTFSTTTVTVNLSSYTGIVDSLFNNVTSQQNVTISNPSEVIYNACVCIPPVASFTPDSYGNMHDNSTWADKWYWTCTCAPGIDSTVINKIYYGIMQNGTYTVCLKVKNSCGVDSICQPFNYVFVTVNLDENTGNIINNFYPNPFHDKLIISRGENNFDMNTIQIRVVNSIGLIVYSDKMETSQKEIQLNELSPGLYFIQCSSGNRVVSKKLIKE